MTANRFEKKMECIFCDASVKEVQSKAHQKAERNAHFLASKEADRLKRQVQGLSWVDIYTSVFRTI